MSHSSLRPSLSTAWRALLGAALAAAAVLLSPAPASAQGRCSCNNGCHQYPGQCVQPGSNGCAAGYAPFCSTRSDTCPNASWVSCGGACTCVRIAPVDAGTPADAATPVDTGTPTDTGAPVDTGTPTDAPVSPTDTPVGVDAPVSRDVGSPTDAPVGVDAQSTSDVPASFDAPGVTDRPVASDTSPALDTGVPVGSDAPVTPVDAPAGDAPVTPVDAPLSPGDATVSLDGGSTPGDASAVGDAACDCPGGACVDGVCYRDRCDYNPELGFICSIPGTSCRLIGDKPLCIPFCAGIVCTGMTFCDERAGGRCVSDDCATIQCPAGTVCRRNQCARDDDASVTGATDAALDAAAGDGATGPGLPTATEDGCGCRAGGGRGRPASGAMLLVALGAALHRRRRRAARR